jgi:hypothetical protein
MAKVNRKTKNCKHCDCRFVSYDHDRKYCSRKCSSESKKTQKKPSSCACCGALFFPKYPSQPATTCSRECWAKMRSEEYSDGRMKAVRARAQVVLDRKFAISKQRKSEAAGNG